MSIEKIVAKVLFQLVPQDNFKGKRVITLGNQFVRMKIGELKAEFSELEFESNYDAASAVIDKSPLGNITGEALFKYFGAKEVQSLDMSDHENATVIFDLNSLDLPGKLYEKFDVVYDGGTIEHVFNIVNAFKNIANMVRKGGIIIHHTPANNYTNHGFYQPSPTLFKDFYEANGFKVEVLKLFIWPSYPPSFSEFIMLSIEDIPRENYFADPEKMKLHGAMEIFCVARKIEAHEKVTVPTQGYYTNP
jgi:SAM-dependent methyltransferase